MVRVIVHWQERSAAAVAAGSWPRDELVEVRQLAVLLDRDVPTARRLVPQDGAGGFIAGGPDTGGLVAVLTPDGALQATSGAQLTPRSIARAFDRLHGTDRRRFAVLGSGIDSPMTALCAAGYAAQRYGSHRFHSIFGQR